jgi:iron complex outermembrane recepter protein
VDATERLYITAGQPYYRLMFFRREIMDKQLLKTVVVLLSSTQLGAWTACAFAQANQVQTAIAGNARPPVVEVTGTRLKRTDIETPAPVDIITREDIERSGKLTLADVVRSITTDNNGSIGLGNVSGFAMGSSGVALRGLAVNATLVLINGRRMVSYGLADDVQRTFVNLSAIPLDVVDRVEVLKEGASAVYGSDAIAGVVNIILRDSFQGVSANASYGFAQSGGGETPRLSITGGRGDLATDGYNIFFNLEASKQNAIRSKDRDDRKWIGNGDLRPYGYGFTAGGSGPDIGGWFDNSTGVSNPNRFGAVSLATGPVVWQQLPGCNSTITLPAGLGGCPYDRVKESGVLLPEENKLNLYLRGSMKVSKAFEPYVEFGMFKSDTKSLWVLGPTSANEMWVDPQTNSVRNNSNLLLPAGHPDNPLGTDALLSYLVVDAGHRAFEHDSTAYRTLLGAKGELGEWSYDTGLLYAHNTTKRTLTGLVRNSVLQAGLNGTGPFGYYRLGANAGLNSTAFYQALSPELSTDNVSSLTLLDFKASRDLFALAGGPMGLSVGAEYRRETINAPPIPLTDIGDIVGWPYYVYGGEQKVASAFAEVTAPMSTNLELDGAVRADKVWNSETSITPKVGFKWTPWKQLAIRGTYAEGFRAPNPVEKGTNNTFAAVLDLTGNGFLSLVRNIGNPKLEPERSKTLTFGAIYEPQRTTSLGVNFWWLERRNEINGVDPFAILAGTSGWPDASVIRDSQGNIVEVISPFENNSKSRLKGVDFDINHRMPLGNLGTLNAKLKWTYLHSYEKSFQGGTTLEYAGTHGPMVVSGNTGTPKNKANIELAWERGLVGASAFVNYVGGYTNKDNRDAACFNQFANGEPAPGDCRIGSFTTMDLRGTYKPRKDTELYFSVTNVFDRIAPLDPSSYINLNFNPSFHLAGAIGRTFNIGLRHDF